MPEVKDQYCNQAYLTVTESAANTLTFSKVETGISIFEKVGWIISRIDYDFTIDATNFGATNDRILFGLATSDALANVSLNQSSVIDLNHIKRIDIGTGASGMFLEMPIEKRFDTLPGSGLLVPPNPIYIFAQGVALTSAVQVQARMFYTVKSLKVEDYWELVEMRRMIGA